MKCPGYRKILPLLCGLIVLQFLVSPAHSALVQPAEVESGSVIVTAETAEVREGPSLDAAVITVVGKGEIFDKLGRTGAWYFIRINDDAFGWVNGRAVRNHGAEESPPPYLGPYDDSYYPYYPGIPYDYYSWGLPYLSWEWYVYYRGWRWGRPWGPGMYPYRDGNQVRPWGNSWPGGGDRDRGYDRHRTNPPSRPFVPRLPPIFPRR